MLVLLSKSSPQTPLPQGEGLFEAPFATASRGERAGERGVFTPSWRFSLRDRAKASRKARVLLGASAYRAATRRRTTQKRWPYLHPPPHTGHRRQLGSLAHWSWTTIAAGYGGCRPMGCRKRHSTVFSQPSLMAGGDDTADRILPGLRGCRPVRQPRRSAHQAHEARYRNNRRAPGGGCLSGAVLA